jgi:hypothetical protein
MKPTRRHVTPDQKAQIVRRHSSGKVVEVGEHGQIEMVRARLPLNSVTSVAELPEVRHVIPDVPATLHNDIAETIMVSDADQVVRHQFMAAELPLHGSGQVIGHADSGLDSGGLKPLHAAFLNRLVKAFPRGRMSAKDWSDFGGHGTHTAGSLLGGADFAGFASEAKLVHQSIADERGNLKIPAPLSVLFEEAYTAGARIHSDSWGASTAKHPGEKGEYSRADEVDTWIWNRGDPRDMLIVIAAGNDGKLGEGSVGWPATAKNSLTVGACENYRPGAGMDADDPDKLPVFSSRGPVKHGRTRPDVVAPGTWVASVKTQGEKSVWSDPVETDGGWSVSPAFTLTSSDSVDGGKSWHLKRAANEVFTDRLASPAFDLTSYRNGPPLFVEIWLRGAVLPDQAVYLAVRAADSPASGLDLPDFPTGAIGNWAVADWIPVFGKIEPDYLNYLSESEIAEVRFLVVAAQKKPSPWGIDLFLDHIKLTTFSSWGPISRLPALSKPLGKADLAYTFDGGTSMATPLVAGAAAIVRESLMQGSSGPSAELVKGVLINTTGQIGHRPANQDGWGRVNLKRALESTFLLEDSGWLQTGDTMTYKLKVDDDSKELRATLVWADAPGEKLTNNLDLVLTSPDGVEFKPFDANRNSPDSLNNVEGIDVPTPVKGEWTITVTGSSIKQGRVPATSRERGPEQRFAPVVSGGLDTGH